MTIDRRLDRRILVGPDHAVRFMIQGHAFRHVRITNVSQGGCFATLAQGADDLFAVGRLLEHFAFEHAELPRTPFTARVSFCLGAEDDETGMDYVGLGIQFLSPPAPVMDGLAHFLANYV